MVVSGQVGSGKQLVGDDPCGRDDVAGAGAGHTAASGRARIQYSGIPRRAYRADGTVVVLEPAQPVVADGRVGRRLFSWRYLVVRCPGAWRGRRAGGCRRLARTCAGAVYDARVFWYSSHALLMAWNRSRLPVSRSGGAAWRAPCRLSSRRPPALGGRFPGLPTRAQGHRPALPFVSRERLADRAHAPAVDAPEGADMGSDGGALKYTRPPRDPRMPRPSPRPRSPSCHWTPPFGGTAAVMTRAAISSS